MPSTRILPTAGRAAAVCIALFLMGLPVGCGRKLPPIQPGSLPPPVVADLTHELRGSEILLSWSVPPFNPTKESAPVGFRLLRARQPVDEGECQTCPAPFRAIADIAASGRHPGSRMRFRDELEPGFKYSYKIRAYAADETRGKDSAVLTVTY